jgi:hypothetical protein
MNHRHFKLNQVKARIEGRKARDTIVLTKEEAQKVEEQFSKPNHELLDKIKAKLDSEELQNSENPLSGMLD